MAAGDLKTCAKCRLDKQRDEFNKDSGRGDGLFQWCKACVRAQSRAYYAEHREAVLRRQRAAYEKDPEPALRRTREARTKRPSVYTTYNAAWRRANRGKCRATTAKYRAAQLRATPAWADIEEIRQIYERAAAEGKQVDHIIPLQHPLVCGLHVPGNLQLLTRAENRRKSNRFTPFVTSEVA